MAPTSLGQSQEGLGRVFQFSASTTRRPYISDYTVFWTSVRTKAAPVINLEASPSLRAPGGAPCVSEVSKGVVLDLVATTVRTNVVPVSS